MPKLIYFKNFEDAYKSIGIENVDNSKYLIDEKEVIKCVSLVKGESEYEYTIGTGQIMYGVGIGNPPFNYPVGLQRPFFLAKLNKTEFPLLYKKSRYEVVYMGMYRVDEILKPIANSGYTYFRIKFVRCKLNKQTL